jgi:GT2 family glycosyltransferase
MRLTPDPGTRMIAGGSVLVGGSPVRVLRLTPSGTRQVAGWLAGAPVPAGAGARALARKLLDAGTVHPEFAAISGGRDAHGRTASHRPDGQPVRAAPFSEASRQLEPADVTVVIPVRDRHAELARCLAGLQDLPRVIVVDDASADPLAIKRITAAHGAAVIRRPVNGGPGAARNTGLEAAATDLIAFLDSDCVPGPGWLENLLPHFADPAVGAVAPRIVPHEQGAGWLARYEGASSTLDMGARPSIVRPGARVPYVPGAALVVRKAAVGDGFRERMYVGEDVDFVWRMSAAGWRVRYEPGAVMGHDHRVAFRAWFTRRADYGTSAAALEELHPGAVRPLYASWWTAGAWAALLSGRPVTAAAFTATATALLARRLAKVTGERWPVPGRPPSSPSSGNSKKRLRSGLPRESAAWALAARLAGGGTIAAARPLGSAVSRTWWPVAVPAALAVRKLRLPVAALILLPPVLDWAERKPPLDPVRYVTARLLDDAAYSLGVWQGCLARRTIRPLLPVIGGKRQPG